MDAEHRGEGAELKPADEELAIVGVVRLAAEESADIRVPVGNAGRAKVESGGDLPAKRLPVAADVAGPADRAVTLLPGPCGASEYQRAFLRKVAPLAFS